MSHCVPNWGVELSLATHKPPPGAAHTVHRENVDLVPWYDGHAGGGKAVATAATARDAVVPCAVFGEDEVEGVQVAPDSEGGCTRVGSCSGPAAWEFSKAGDDEGSVNAYDARVPVAEEGWSGEETESASLDMSDTFDGSRRVPTMSSRERELSESLTTSFNSLDNTFSSSWGSGTNTTPSDDNSSSSVFRSKKQRKETNTEERSNKRGISKSSSSTKRSRCKQTDQSHRKRTERIDQRMKKLQRLVPTSKRQTEKDKEWVLDEVIEHVQKLQAQLHQMMTMTMMMPMPVMPMFQQQLPHMPMMMMPMPMMPMGMQERYRQNLAPPACAFPAAYIPAAYPQCHWRPMSAVEEAHSRMAAASLMQHHQQFPFIFQHANFF